MDLSQFLKSEYQSLYKMRKSFGDVLNDARKAQNVHRRMTRNAEIFLKRHIDEGMMSPYVTPGRRKTPKKKIEKPTDQTKLDLAKSKRYEQLLAWKQQKEKKKQEQKQKAKPLFKVMHLPVAIGLPNLENVNKLIKGKLITAKHNETYKFAPTNHEFKAPSNIKPVKVELNATKPARFNFDNTRRITRSQKAILPVLELPTSTRRHKVKDTNKVQPTRPAVKLVPKNTKKVALHVEIKTPKSDLKVYKKTPAKLRGNVNSIESTKYDGTSRRNVVQKGKSEDTVKAVKSKSVKGKSTTESDCKTPVKSNKGLLVSVPLSNNTEIDTFDTRKHIKMKLGKNSEVEISESEATDNEIKNETVDDHKTPVKTKRASTRKGKSLQSRSNSRISRHLEEVTSSEDAEISPKQVKMNERQQGRRKSKQSDNLEAPIKVGKSKSETTENKIVDDRKTPVKMKRVSVRNRKSQQPRGSARKSRLLNENQEDVTSTEETEITTCDSPKKVKIGTKQRRRLKSLSLLSSEYPVEDVHSDRSDVDDGKECVTTPKKKDQAPVVYISPFVTISRGKSSARKEFFHRKSKGGECDSSPDVRRNTGPKAGAAYFRRIVEQEMNRIQGLCDEWTDYKNNQSPPEEASDMINVTIGQSQLLISKKFKQFQGLINSCENGDSEIAVTCEDLHGYWDVAYIQVENLDKRFENLKNLRRNNWQEILPQTNKAQAKKKLGQKKPKGKVTSSLKDAIKAARMKAKSQKSATDDENQSENTTTFDGKFFTITSPHKSPLKKPSLIEPSKKTPGHERKSLRATVLSSEASKHKRTPGWTIIKASHLALNTANNEGLEFTPGRSILKNSQSVKKSSKSVLFKDNVRVNVNLNETYPPTISNEKSSGDVFPVLTNITNNDDASKRTPKRRSRKNKLF